MNKLAALFVIFMCTACEENRWKFTQTNVDNEKIIYTGKISGMLVGDLIGNDKNILESAVNSDQLYDFYINYNGYLPHSSFTKRLKNKTSFYFYSNKTLQKYYWATRTINRCNFSEISIALFKKIPKDLSFDEIKIIKYVLLNKQNTISENILDIVNEKNKYRYLIDKKIDNEVKNMYENSKKQDCLSSYIDISK